jgi:hypothetical protein
MTIDWGRYVSFVPDWTDRADEGLDGALRVPAGFVGPSGKAG